ncbi:MAG: TetR/AcrR family transcriptional regulator [Acidobacteriota bacterium]|jgi:AcrR family transcriptional regulator
MVDSCSGNSSSAEKAPSRPSPLDRILDAAAEVFAEEGFDGARVDAIATRAGVNKAMLYYHVGDKGELYAAVLARNLERAHRRLAAAAAIAGPVRQRLGTMILALAELVEEIPHHPRIMLREIASGAAHLPDGVVAQVAELLGLVRRTLEEGVASGELRPMDPLLTHLMILGAVSFMTATRPVRERLRNLGAPISVTETPAHLASYLTQVILDGIAVPGGHP